MPDNIRKFDISTTLDAEALLPLDTVRNHCVIEHNEDDDLLVRNRLAALTHIGHHTRRKIGMTVTAHGFKSWPSPIVITANALRGIAGISYQSDTDTNEILPLTDVITDYTDDTVTLDLGTQNLPALSTRKPYPVRVDVISGYGAVTTAIVSQSPVTAMFAKLPEDIEQAALMLIGHYNENREAVVTGTSAVELPQAVQTLLFPYLNYRAR